MRRKICLCLVIVLIVVSSICMIVFGNRADKISAREAEELLLEHLINLDRWEPDYVIEPDNPVAGEIDNEHGYRIEIRYKDTVEQVAGRLVSNYAVTDDGKKIFRYDPANDEWIMEE